MLRGPHQYIWPADWPKVNTACFHIPLRIPLRLPDRFVLPIGSSPHDLDSRGYPEIDPTQLIGFIDSPDEPFPDDPIGVYVPFCVHQIEGNTNTPETEAAFAAAQRRPWLHKPHISPFQTPILTTILECCISLGDISHDDSRDALDGAFDKVLSEVNAFLRGYMILTREQVALVYKEPFPFAIPCGWN